MQRMMKRTAGYDMGKEPIRITLDARIDAENSAAVRQDLEHVLEGNENAPVILDADRLSYISSSGLRVILQVWKKNRNLSVINVRPDVYDIFEMTGFTEMMPVQKAYRTVSVEGCEVIGEGGNGRIYRLDRENVVKVYRNREALEEIRHEREMAKKALILGLPTAISYDVVRTGDGYGAVFELLDAKTFSNILSEDPGKMEWCVREYVKLLRIIHGTAAPEGELPSAKALALEWIRGMTPLLPADSAGKLAAMTEAVPETGKLIHGDLHTKNVVLSDGEVLLIDMDTLSAGHPVFELSQMYAAFVGFGEYDPEVLRAFMGYDAGTGKEFWKRSLAAYLDAADESSAVRTEDKVRCIAYARLIDWSRRHREPGDRRGMAERELWIRELTGLLRRVDSLVF